MSEPTNVVNPGQSPTPPVTNTPTPPGSPASPASPSPEGAKPGAAPAPAIPGVGTKPPEGYVPIDALHEERNKRQSLDTKLQQLNALFGDRFTVDASGNIVPLGGQTPPGLAPAQDDPRARLEKLWEDDPKAAVRAEMAMAFQWYDRVNTAVNMQKNSVRSAHSDFSKYETSVDQYISNLPVEARSKPGVVELAYLVVKGQNADDIKANAVAEVIERIKRGESIQGLTGGTFTPPSAPSTIQPTNDEIAVANAMGVKIEDYLKFKVK